MSAYVLDPVHINLIVGSLEKGAKDSASLQRHFPALKYVEGMDALYADIVADPEEVGKTLYAMNVNAVEQRYPDSDKLPGRYSDGKNLDEYRYESYLFKPLNIIQVYKIVGSYLYQCSEGDVPSLPLFKMMQRWRCALAMRIVESMPEYEQAPWA